MPSLLGDEGHRAVQLGGEAARDAAGPVGDLDLLAITALLARPWRSAACLAVLLGLGSQLVLALDVQVEFLAVLLGVLVDRLDLVLGAARELVVDAGDPASERAHLAGLDRAEAPSAASRAFP